MLRQLLL